MPLSEKSIGALAALFTGDGALPPNGRPVAPYRTGPNLVTFFNKFGFTDEYAQGFPTRRVFVEQKIRALDGTPKLARAVEAALHPREFLDTTFDPQTAVEYVNRYLVHDDLEIVSVAGHFRLRQCGRPGVDLDPGLLTSDDPLTEAFAREQVEKCRRKIAEADYYGAITNARALVEAVLVEVERRRDAKRQPFDGDLPKLYKRVQRLVNLGPEREDVAEPLRQVLRGLANIVAGLAPARNKMSDAHAPTHRPQRHHAVLVVNAAMTFAEFILESYDYQVLLGRVRPSGPAK